MSDDLNIGYLATRPLQDHAADGEEIGYFELDVDIPRAQFFASGDKAGLAKKTIATHLASAMMDTQVPQNYWAFWPSREFRKEFNWPEVMEFKA